MVFYFRSPTGAAPTPADCQAIADAYGLWENTGSLLGYFLLRSEDSSFTGANVWSIDDRAQASFVDTPFSRSGFIPNLLFAALATSQAPIVRWATAELGKASGRTYALGLTMAVNDTKGDKELVNGVYLAALTSIFSELGPSVQAATGYRQVHVARSRRQLGTRSPRWFDITGCGTYELMGTQRRRTRRGR